MLRTKQRDLGFGDLRGGGPDRAEQLQTRHPRRRSRGRRAAARGERRRLRRTVVRTVEDPGSRRRATPAARTPRSTPARSAVSASVERGPSTLIDRSAAMLRSRSSSSACTISGSEAPTSSLRNRSSSNRSAASSASGSYRPAATKSSASLDIGGYPNDPGSSMRSPSTRPVVPIASSGAGGSARSVVACTTRRRPGRIERRRAQHDPVGRVPEQRRARAVPPDRERQEPGAQRQIVHREVLTQPLRREPRDQHDLAVGLVDEDLAHHREVAGRIRGVVERSRGCQRVGDSTSPAGPAPLTKSTGGPRRGGFGVESPVLERDDRIGRRRREQQVGARRVDLFLPRIGQLRPQAAVELQIPAACDSIGVGQRCRIELLVTDARRGSACGAAAARAARPRRAPANRRRRRPAPHR